ncbi:GDSL-type esterase/lipase family protein [Alistipes putredinis]|uniref:SGNH/GDSL hydrolase family protein n=1 Tax=Alistipes putredinis TaxID=28117 RepID=UPI003F7C7C5B
MASEYTPNYNLDLYTDSDKPNLRDQYNGAITKIDTQLHEFSNNLVIVTEAANMAKDKANENATEIADEVTRAKAAEKANADAISAETTRATAAEKANADAISMERDRALIAEQENATSINNIKETIASEGAKLKGAAYLDTTPTVVDNSSLIPTSKAVYDFTSKEKKTILCFGDSYADTSVRNNSWAYALQDYFGWTVKNYAVSGAGWNVDTRTFYNQLQTAISREGTDYNIDDVYALVVAGGRNDIMTASEATSYVNTFMQAATTHYKNTKIFVVPMLYDWQTLGITGRVKADAIGNAAANYGAEVVNYAWEWLRGEKSCIQSDNVHPNAAGAKRIAGYMNSALNGCYTPRYVSKSYNWSGAELYCLAQGGTVTINIRGSFSSAPSTEKILDEIFWPDLTYAGVGAVTGAGTPQLFFIENDGTIQVYNNQSVTGFVGLSMTFPW